MAHELHFYVITKKGQRGLTSKWYRSFLSTGDKYSNKTLAQSTEFNNYGTNFLQYLLDLRYTSTNKVITRSSAIADKPRDTFRGQSRSPNMVPFHMLGMVSC